METLERTLTSNEVAKMVDKEHSKLIRDIKNYIGYLAEAKIGSGDFFIESTYLDGNNQSRPNYLLTKQGCEMVSNKLTGAKGVTFTAKYVSRFNELENHIKKIKQQLDMSQLSPELQIAQQLLNATSNLEIKQRELEAKVESLGQELANKNSKEIIQIDHSLYHSTEIAEQFGYVGTKGTNRFLLKLYEYEIIYPRKYGQGRTDWRLYKKYKNKGYKDMSSRARAQLWTAKGKRFIESVMRGEEF